MPEVVDMAPLDGEQDSAQPHEIDAVSRADYDGWWDRAVELSDYIAKVPSSVIEKVDMADRRNKLVFEFDQLGSPSSESEPVPTGAVGQLKRWISQAEGFVGFLLQSFEPAAPITQVPVLVSGIDDEEWQWPWIDGWDDPKKRKKILHPAGKEESQVKKLLIGGAVIGGALFIGKRFMETD